MAPAWFTRTLGGPAKDEPDWKIGEKVTSTMLPLILVVGVVLLATTSKGQRSSWGALV